MSATELFVNAIIGCYKINIWDYIRNIFNVLLLPQLAIFELSFVSIIIMMLLYNQNGLSLFMKIMQNIILI